MGCALWCALWMVMWTRSRHNGHAHHFNGHAHHFRFLTAHTAAAYFLGLPLLATSDSFSFWMAFRSFRIRFMSNASFLACRQQHINTSTHQHINTSTHQHVNTATHQHVKTSTRQHGSTGPAGESPSPSQRACPTTNRSGSRHSSVYAVCAHMMRHQPPQMMTSQHRQQMMRVCAWSAPPCRRSWPGRGRSRSASGRPRSPGCRAASLRNSKPACAHPALTKPTQAQYFDAGCPGGNTC